MVKDYSSSRKPGFEGCWSVKGFLVIFIMLVLISNANAVCTVGGCGGDSGDSWGASADAFMNSDVPGSFISSNTMTADVSSETSIDKVSSKKDLNNTTTISIEPVTINYVSAANRSENFVNGGILEPLLDVSDSDVVIDATNGNNFSDRPFIKGASHLPSKSFLYANGTLRPISELTGILGNAGISSEDRAVIYGDSPATADATFVFWVMRYLGLDNVKVLDGGLNDWMSANLPLESEPIIRNPTIYEPRISQELLADYNYVEGGKAQIVDAGTAQEFGNKRIPGSISIDSAQVLENGRIKDSTQLNDTFSVLRKDKPVVVYSEDELNASLVWYALQLMGYDSSLYTWNDWEEHQKEGGPVARTKTLSIESLGTYSSKVKKLG